MKKIIVLISMFFVVQNFSATEILNNQITIPKHYKTENTFSGDLSKEDSFHLIFTKNKKTREYEVFTYLFDGKDIQKLNSFHHKESYSVVSFHHKDDILSLLLSFKIKKKPFLKKINYNLITKEKIEFESTSHEDFLTSIRQKDKSILVYKSDEFFKVINFIGKDSPVIKEIKIENKDDQLNKFFKGKSVSSIKTDEFVANGSTNTVRLYFEDNTLFFTRDSDEPLNVNIAGISLNNKKTNVTQLLKLNLETDNLVPEILTFENANGEKFKKATSFFTKDKLFQLALSKKQGFINIADVNTGEVLNNISLDASISEFVKGNSEFVGIDKFLNNAGRNKHNATITANKTASDKIRIRLDYVDITYNYNYNWWWHHQQFMWHQQQHQMFIQNQIQRSIPTGFGPKQPNDFAFENAVIIKQKRFFELLLDANGNLLNEDLPETIYKEIDKKEYIDKLDDISDYSMESSCFLKDSFRFIAYSKRNKHFIIQTNNIK